MAVARVTAERTTSTFAHECRGAGRLGRTRPPIEREITVWCTLLAMTTIYLLDSARIRSSFADPRR